MCASRNKVVGAKETLNSGNCIAHSSQGGWIVTGKQRSQAKARLKRDKPLVFSTRCCSDSSLNSMSAGQSE